MQTLWSRAARSNCTCRCLLCLNAARQGLSRRATTAAGRRQVKFKDAVLATYVTIFASGIIADRHRKDGKRQEWDRKIAEVQEEVELLRKRNDERMGEGRPLAAAIQRGIAIHNQVPGNRRMYSIARYAPVLDESDNSDAVHVVDEEPEEAPSSCGIAADLRISSQLEGIQDVENSNVVEMWNKSGLEPSLRLRAIRSFSVKRLALKLILRPAILHSYGQPESFHVGAYIPRTYLDGVFGDTTPQNVQALLHELAETKRHIFHAKTGHTDDEELSEILGNADSFSEEANRQERRRLDDELRRIFGDFHSGRIDLKDLLFKVSTNLLQSPVTPLTSTFEILVQNFTKARQNDLVHLVLESFRESRRGLSTKLIDATLRFYIRSKDLFSFDRYITWLTGREKTAIFFESWKTVSVGNREVAIPPLQDARILQTLIYAALRFDQPHRAEMWLAVLRRNGMADTTNALTAFLKYYALTCDWGQGKPILEKALEVLQARNPSGPENENKNMERMAFWMLHLCLSCRQVEPYRRLLNYAVDKGLDYTILGRYKQSWQASAILQDWRDARFSYPERLARRHEDNRAEPGILDDSGPSDQYSEKKDFSPISPVPFHLANEKAANAARAALYNTSHISTQFLSKVPEGAVLKSSAVGYRKEDLDSMELPEDLIPDNEYNHSNGSQQEDRDTSKPHSNLPSGFDTLPNRSEADRIKSLLIERLSLADDLHDLTNSINSVASEIEILEHHRQQKLLRRRLCVSSELDEVTNCLNAVGGQIGVLRRQQHTMRLRWQLSIERGLDDVMDSVKDIASSVESIQNQPPKPQYSDLLIPRYREDVFKSSLETIETQPPKPQFSGILTSAIPGKRKEMPKAPVSNDAPDPEPVVNWPRKPKQKTSTTSTSNNKEISRYFERTKASESNTHVFAIRKVLAKTPPELIRKMEVFSVDDGYGGAG